jgi:hypothetical protein
MSRVRIGVTVLAMALMGAAYFQDDKQPVKLRGQLPAYFGKLGLRDDQRQQIYKLRAGYKVKVDDLRRQIEKLKAEEKVALEKVLTAEQLKRLRELRSGEKATEKPRNTDKAKDKGK